MNQQQRICLNMIVKNESSIIRRCLDSVRAIIDYWVIVDTGSTDGTQKIIKDHLKDLPGELIERPWVHFAHNRSEAINYAKGKCDYILIIDADEVLKFTSDFIWPDLIMDAYSIETCYEDMYYTRTQLVSSHRDWYFKGVLHEYITLSESFTIDLLRGVYNIPFSDGARSRDVDKYKKDAIILEQALVDEPDNARYVFYLAQSYRDANDIEQAIFFYEKRVQMGGWKEEVWYSLYQIAVLQERLEYDWPFVLNSYLKE